MFIACIGYVPYGVFPLLPLQSVTADRYNEGLLYFHVSLQAITLATYIFLPIFAVRGRNPHSAYGKQRFALQEVPLGTLPMNVTIRKSGDCAIGFPWANEVNGFFNSHNLSSRTVALGSTQPLTEVQESSWG
jgi:hypothetical protein